MLLGAVALCLASGSLPTLAQADLPQYQSVRIEHAGELDHVFPADLDGDGRQELVLQTGKTLSIYPHSAEGVSGTPGFQITLPGEAVLYQLSSVTGKKAKDLVFLTGDGVSFFRSTEGRFAEEPETLLTVQTLFRGIQPANVLAKDFLEDLDQDGRPELILPLRKGVGIYAADEKGAYRPKAILALPPRVLIYAGEWKIDPALRSYLAAPPYRLLDANGDHRSDLVYVVDDWLSVFCQDDRGSFPRKPTWRLYLRGDHRKKVQKRRWVEYEVPPFVGDLNGDGYLDVVLSEPGKGETTMLYGGKSAAGTPGESPEGTSGAAESSLLGNAEMIKLEGWIVENLVEDLNGDGRPDLVLLRLEKLGLSGILQVLFTKTLELELLRYLAHAEKGFRDSYAAARTFQVPLTFFVNPKSGIRVETPFFFSVEGDFDRDGLRDLVVKADNAALAVHRGDVEAGFQETAIGTLPIFSAEGFTIVDDSAVKDLNADGFYDLLIHQQNLQTRQHVIEVLLAQP